MPSNAPSRWTVHLKAYSGWMYIGIIGSTSGVSASSYSFASSYGWAAGAVYIAGKENYGHGGWAGWDQGDEATLTYNPLDHSLSMFLSRTGVTYRITGVNLSEAYIHVNLYRQNDRVRISLP